MGTGFQNKEECAVKCAECGKEMVMKNKTYVANLENCVIIIKNVPAYVCSCGEAYYSDDVFEKLEQIVVTLKKVINDIAVVDYTKAA